MTAVNEVLSRYIDRLEDDIKKLRNELSAYRATPCGADIKKALHDASNVIGMEPSYKISDPDVAAVKWIQELVTYVESKR